MRGLTRRRVLAAGSSLAALGAGCTRDPSSDGPTSTGTGAGTTSVESTTAATVRAQASLYAFADVASHVAGDAATVGTPVPTGQHGHDWVPESPIRADGIDADLFVYVHEGFQPWADEVVATAEDGAGIVTVDAASGVDLLDRDRTGGGNRSAERDAGEVDPHFWLDPRRTARSVKNVRDGFVEVDADHADVYASNAESYRSRLEDLDATFESELADRSRGVVVVAGHNAFGYLAARYGFEIETVMDGSRDDRSSADALEHARTVVEDRDVEYVLADPLESGDAAARIVEHTAVEDTLPLTSLAGRTDDWSGDDWGYVTLMEELNLPTLRKALGAE